MSSSGSGERAMTSQAERTKLYFSEERRERVGVGRKTPRVKAGNLARKCESDSGFSSEQSFIFTQVQTMFYRVALI